MSPVVLLLSVDKNRHYHYVCRYDETCRISPQLARLVESIGIIVTFTPRVMILPFEIIEHLSLTFCHFGALVRSARSPYIEQCAGITNIISSVSCIRCGDCGHIVCTLA